MIDVDQSGKIGDTRLPTVVAYSNDVQRSILIPSTVKRRCVHHLREKGMAGGTLYMYLFAQALFLLLRPILAEKRTIVIDTEYPGHEREIKQQLINLCRRNGIQIDPSFIRFAHIGKKSRAHTLAITTFRRKQAPDQVITLEELLGRKGVK